VGTAVSGVCSLSRWTAGGMAVIFVVGIFFYGAYTGVGSA